MTARLFLSGFSGSRTVGRGGARLVDLTPNGVAAGPLVSDTFTRANATGIGSAETGEVWGGSAATWRIVSNAVRMTAAPAPGYEFIYADSGATNVTITMKVIPSNLSGNDVGIVGRWTDNLNHILFDLTKTGGGWLCRAFEMVAGVGYTGVTTLQNPVAQLVNNYDPFYAKMTVVGTAGEVFLTDQVDFNTWYSQGTWTVSAGLTGTNAGIAANQSDAVSFDDFLVVAA
jgi:hypothetical protein